MIRVHHPLGDEVVFREDLDPFEAVDPQPLMGPRKELQAVAEILAIEVCPCKTAVCDEQVAVVKVGEHRPEQRRLAVVVPP